MFVALGERHPDDCVLMCGDGALAAELLDQLGVSMQEVGLKWTPFFRPGVNVVKQANTSKSLTRIVRRDGNVVPRELDRHQRPSCR